MKIEADDVSLDFLTAVVSLSIPVAHAATLAIQDAGKFLLKTAQSHIHQVGFSNKWERAYKVTVYPKNKYSIDAAAFGLFKGIPYSDIFGIGGHIKGSHLLWIPFPTTPKIDRRKTAADVSDYKKNSSIKMVSFKSKAGVPLLAVNVQMTRTQSRKSMVRLSLGEIISGQKKLTKKQRSKNPTLVSRAIPLFHGVNGINIKKRFNWDKVVETVQNQVPAFYDAAVNKLAE